MKFQSLLMVCIGNVCRSPMAEILAKEIYQQEASQLRIASAGIEALVDAQADAHVQSLMRERGLDASQHRARQLTQALLADFELILVMEPFQVQLVHQRFPQTRGRVHLLGKWNDAESIADPYRKPKAHFVAACSAIERNLRLWQQYV